MNKKVLFLFGGESSEHNVSIASATNVYNAIDKQKYDILLAYIDTAGKWWLIDNFEQHENLADAQEILPVFGENVWMVASGERIKADVILPVLHGKNGEDGSVQGVAQLLHIPIVGCDMISSALCMDKIATKQVMQANNIPVVDYVTHLLGEPLPDISNIIDQLGLPLFVKPARAGSSVGVTKVHTRDEFAAAVSEAHRHDKMVLIESCMDIREIEVAVLGTPPFHKAALPGEIKPGAEFYSYDDKYAASSTSSVAIPAELDDTKLVEIQRLGKKVYQLLGCSGLARVDFFLAADGMVYLNEVNTLPGFTNISMYPKLWQGEGMGSTELIDYLIDDALGAHATIEA